MRESPDEIKFSSTYDAHARAVLGYALRTRPADAADVVAETMLTAWRRFDVMPDEPEPSCGSMASLGTSSPTATAHADGNDASPKAPCATRRRSRRPPSR